MNSITHPCNDKGGNYSMLTTTSPFMKVMNGVNLMYVQIMVTQSHVCAFATAKVRRKTEIGKSFPQLILNLWATKKEQTPQPAPHTVCNDFPPPSIICLYLSKNIVKLSKNNKDYLLITKLCCTFVVPITRQRALVSGKTT